MARVLAWLSRSFIWRRNLIRHSVTVIVNAT